MSDTKTIAITGASSGIGAALTKALANDGHRLFVCARREDRLAEVTDAGRLARYQVTDVSDETQVRSFFAEIEKSFGALDVLITCAGAYGPIGLFHENNAQAWWSAVQANLFGTYLAAKYAVPLMRPEHHPRIVTFSGGGAFNPLPRYSSYAVSKAGIVRLTETMAEELAPLGITVNGVAPGFVATEIHDATLAAGPDASGTDFFAMTKRKLEGDSVSVEIPVNCVRYLLSEAANGLTGKTISAGFDPWDTPEFTENTEQINASSLYTMQRINLVHLPSDSVCKLLHSAEKKEQE